MMTNTRASQIFCMVSVACITIFSCGDANSNNLPARSDGSGGVSETAASTLTDSSAASPGLPANPAPADTGKLAGTWFLMAVLPSDTAAGKVPTITFDEAGKRFTGNTGCNNMRGTFSGTDSTIKISEQIVTTRMACAGYNEDAFLKNLPKATHYRFENGMLVMMSGQTELTRWTREPVKRTTKEL